MASNNYRAPRRVIRGVTKERPKGTLHLSTQEPKPPVGADFALYIDFAKGVERPERVFQAANEMIRALQALDRTLCASIDSSIEPLMVLEEIETGSIKIWLTNQLKRVDDEAFKKIDWKPIVGEYLVKAKYAFIKWSNKNGEDRSLKALTSEIRKIAEETDVRHVPDYSLPSTKELAEAAKAVDFAKAVLDEKDRMSFVPASEPSIDFDLAVRWLPNELSDLLIKRVETRRKIAMTLIVKRPDYLGKAKWDLRSGKKTISAKIEDSPWLDNFHSRKINLRPGDAIKCLVDLEIKYGHENEIIEEEYLIIKILHVVEHNQYRQSDLFKDI